MKIGQFLDAVEITDFVPSAYPQVYELGWVLARFGRGLVGLHDNPQALGRELRAQEDFFGCRSGLLDSHRVVFTFHDIVQGHTSLATAFRRQLEWMVDCRRDPETIRSILGLMPDCAEPGDHAKHNSNLKIPNLQNLADQLALSYDTPAHRGLIQGLLEGNLYKAREALTGGVPADRKLLKAVREMYVVWCLFDMQVMAARLYHAEKNADEAGSANDPSLLTVRSVGAFIDHFIERAHKFEEAFKAGRSEAELSEKLRSFIREHDLEAHARRNAKQMEFTAEQLESGSLDHATRRKLLRFLKDVRSRAEHLQGAFRSAVRGGSMVATRTSFASRKGSTRKERRADGPQFTPSKLLVEANVTASTIRFSMPVLTALSYSIQRVVQAIATIPSDDSVISFSGSVVGDRPLLSREDARRLRNDLLEIYRTKFTRDRYSERVKKKKATEISADPSPPAANVHVLARAAGDDREESKPSGISNSLNAELNLLERYRTGNDREPEEEYIDWVFETSLVERLNGPLQARSKARELRAAEVKIAV